MKYIQVDDEYPSIWRTVVYWQMSLLSVFSCRLIRLSSAPSRAELNLIRRQLNTADSRLNYQSTTVSQMLTCDGEDSHLAVPPNFVLCEQIRQQHQHSTVILNSQIRNTTPVNHKCKVSQTPSASPSQSSATYGRSVAFISVCIRSSAGSELGYIQCHGR